ncbi:MAG: complex I NDUFA9 subunit family protein, partial [Rhodospirillaceae bacterium]
GQVVPWQVDIGVPAEVATAVAGADTVYNLVGILYERGSRTFQRVHVDGGANIAQAAANAGARRLIHLSAIGAAADSPAAYGRTKFAGEEAARAAFPDVSVFRPSVIFGPEDGFFNLFAGLSRILPVLPVIGAPLLPKGDGRDGGCNFQPVYVGDVAQALFAAMSMDETRGQTYELGGPRVFSFKQMMQLLLKVTERKKPLVPVPLGLASFEALFLQHLPTPLLTPDQVAMMERDNVVSGGAKGFADLGIQPTAPEAILPTYLHRFRTPSHQKAHA